MTKAVSAIVGLLLAIFALFEPANSETRAGSTQSLQDYAVGGFYHCWSTFGRRLSHQVAADSAGKPLEHSFCRLNPPFERHLLPIPVAQGVAAVPTAIESDHFRPKVSPFEWRWSRYGKAV